MNLQQISFYCGAVSGLIFGCLSAGYLIIILADWIKSLIFKDSGGAGNDSP